MEFNKIYWTPVGADLSCTPPIYRPSVGVPLSGLYCETASSVQSDRFYYPDLKVIALPYGELTPEYLYKNYDVLYLSEYWTNDTLRSKFPKSKDSQQINCDKDDRGEHDAAVFEGTRERHARNGCGILAQQITLAAIDCAEQEAHNAAHHRCYGAGSSDDRRRKAGVQREE